MKITVDLMNKNSMTLKEAAEYLDVTHQRVYSLQKQGLIEKLKGGGFFRPSVEEYLKTRNRKGGRPPLSSSAD